MSVVHRNLVVLSFVALLPLSACVVVGEEGEATETPETPDSVEAQQTTELAFPDETGEILDVYFVGKQIQVEQIGEEFVFEGDILLPPALVSFEAPSTEEGPVSSVGRTRSFWPNNTVYYVIDPNLSSPTRVTNAIAHWETKTDVTFVRRTTQTNYVSFQSGSGCSSYVGMIGGKQPISLSSACSTGNIIHEIAHAVGFWHEQSRADRDEDVTIHWTNIRSGTEHNFRTYAEMGFDGDEYTANLDFGSVMLYGSYSFTKNGSPTITRKDGSTFSIQRNALSTGDLDGINYLYPVDGRSYVIAKVTVRRSAGKWYYYSRTYGWKQVILRDGRWYYA